MILFRCPHCAKDLQAHETQAGVTGPCPMCGEQVTAPGGASVMAFGPPAAALPQPGPLPRPAPARVLDDSSEWSARAVCASLPFQASVIAALTVMVGGWLRPSLFMSSSGIHVSELGSTAAQCVVAFAAMATGSLLLALMVSGMEVWLRIKRFGESLGRVYSVCVVLSCVLGMVGLLAFQSMQKLTVLPSSVTPRPEWKPLVDKAARLDSKLEHLGELASSSHFTAGARAAEQMRALNSEMMTEMVRAQKEFHDQLDTAQAIRDLFNPVLLGADVNFVRADASLAAIRRAFSTKQEKVELVLQQFLQKCEKILLENKIPLQDPEAQQKILTQVQNAGERVRLMLDHMTALLEYLRLVRQDWQVEDGHFLFQREAELNRFNELKDELTASLEEVQRMHEAAQQRASE